MKKRFIRVTKGSADSTMIKRYLDKHGLDYEVDKGVYIYDFIVFKADKYFMKEFKKEFNIVPSDVWYEIKN